MQAVLVLLWWSAVAALWVWVWRRKKRKKRETQEAYEELRSFAESRGWAYERTVPGLVDSYQGASPLPAVCEGIAGNHVVTGSHRGFGFRAFEHSYSGVDGSVDLENAETASITIHSFWALHLGVDVPDLRVYQDGWFDTVSRGRAMETGIPQLDEDFHIVSREEWRALDVLRGGLAEFLTSDDRASTFGLRLYDGQLITWRERSTLRSGTFEEPLDYLVDVAAHMGVTAPGQAPRTA